MTYTAAYIGGQVDSYLIYSKIKSKTINHMFGAVFGENNIWLTVDVKSYAIGAFPIIIGIICL